MAKQRTLEFSSDAELDADFEATFDEPLVEELEVEFDPADKSKKELHTDDEDAETAERVALTPEAALEHLLTLGRAQGYVSYDDVLRVMPEAENNMEQVEDVFAGLFE